MLRRSLAVITASIALLFLGAIALAADVPSPPPVVRAAPQPYDPFTGWALIGEVGYGEGKLNPEINGVADIKPVGFVGGVGVQYRSRVGNAYFGIASTIDFSSMKDTISPSNNVSVTGKTTWLGRTTLQLGTQVFPNWLVYVSGGAAYGSNKATIAFGGNSVTDAQTSAGWTVGAGVDINISQYIANSTLGFEYAYVNLGNSAYCFAVGGGACFGVNAKDANNLLFVNYKYKFGS